MSQGVGASSYTALVASFLGVVKGALLLTLGASFGAVFVRLVMIIDSVDHLTIFAGYVVCC